MAKIKFQCKCGKILSCRSENVVGESTTKARVKCENCQKFYDLIITILES